MSVDYKIGTTTGISAHDRAATLRAICDVKAESKDFNRPGHMLPLRARTGGVLERAGHTEASVDLARLAGLYPAGALCELVNKYLFLSLSFCPTHRMICTKRYGLS